MSTPYPAETNPEHCLSNYPGSENPFRMYDPEGNKNDIQLAKDLQQELNQISSAPVTIFLLLDTTIDPLYGETKNPRYSSQIPGVIGSASPMSLRFELDKWGIDSQTELLIFFTKVELMNKCGRILQQGDLVYDYRKFLFEVTEQFEDTSVLYEFINQYVFCRRRLGDLPMMGGEVNQPKEGQDIKSEPKIDTIHKENFYSY